MKRTPMPPRTEPMRHAPKAVPTQDRRQREKRPRTHPAEFSPKTRLAIRARAGNGDPFDARCEACGKWLGRHGGEIQHRRARKAGGSRDPLLGSAQNGVLLCGPSTDRRTCHGRCEDRGDEHMHGMGFWLRDGEDPSETPVMLHGIQGGVTVWLTADGGYSLTAPPAGDAA